jgi:hypothetical protein
MKKRKKSKKKRQKEQHEGEAIFLIVVICLITISLFTVDYVITGQTVTSVPRLCKDSDGDDSFIKGKVEIQNVMYEPFIENVFYDYCSDEQIVTEYICEWENSNSVAKTKEYVCEYGCYNGACIAPRLTNQNIFAMIYSGIAKIFGK